MLRFGTCRLFIENGARTTCDTVSAIREERSIVVDMQEGVL
jgi:hypothetical protein